MDLMAIWHSSDVAIKAALIGASATLLAAVCGFSAVIFQIGAQGRQSRSTIVENQKREIKAAMYEDALLVCRAMSDASIELSNNLRIMEIQLAAASQAAYSGMNYNLPAARFPALSAGYGRFSDAAIKVIYLIENRRIVDPRLLVFRTALSTVLHDTRQIMFSDFVVHLMTALPVDAPTGEVFPYTPPKAEQLNAIRPLVAKFIDSLGDGVAYGEDLLVDLQNILLGDLFGRTIPHRNPPDPSKRASRRTRPRIRKLVPDDYCMGGDDGWGRSGNNSQIWKIGGKLAPAIYTAFQAVVTITVTAQ